VPSRNLLERAMARYRYVFLRSDERKKATAKLYEKPEAAAPDLGGELIPKGEHGAFARPRRLARIHYLPTREVADLAELEFGEYGRDPRFLPGWWILPGLLVGFPLMIWVVSLLV